MLIVPLLSITFIFFTFIVPFSFSYSFIKSCISFSACLLMLLFSSLHIILNLSIVSSDVRINIIGLFDGIKILSFFID